MKRVLMCLIAVLWLSGCEQAYDNFYIGLIGKNKLYYNPEFEKLKTFRQIYSWIYYYVEYSDYNQEEVKSPRETVESGIGNCVDLSILFINISYYVFDTEMELVLVDMYGRTIENGNPSNHAMIRYNGTLYPSPYAEDVYSVPVNFSYFFEDILY